MFGSVDAGQELNRPSFRQDVGCEFFIDRHHAEGGFETTLRIYGYTSKGASMAGTDQNNRVIEMIDHLSIGIGRNLTRIYVAGVGRDQSDRIPVGERRGGNVAEILFDVRT